MKTDYLILVAVSVDLDAGSAPLVAPVLSFVAVAGGPGELASSFFEVIDPVSLVPVAVLPGVPAFAVSLVALDVALVDSVLVL